MHGYLRFVTEFKTIHICDSGASKSSGLVKRGSISGSLTGLNKSSSPSGSVSNLASGEGAKVSLKLGKCHLYCLHEKHVDRFTNIGV